jgi:hypothetical protein
MKIKFIKRCVKHPEIGAHVHYDGKTEMIDEKLSGIEVAYYKKLL